MQKFKIVMKYLLAVFFIAAGMNHFVHAGFYLRMMPPYLPWHEAMNYLSGAAEILLGALVLFPRYTRLAGYGLIALLIAVFPANLHMALNSDLFPEYNRTGLFIRLPFQLVFILWAWWATKPDAEN
ncbi:MAG: MauE/DoxX family redox-associated membrane protein [Blastocatellales bacterium]